ncbi:MAG: bifunctional UDP-N-acetylglucosamine pyrophosphorylase / glucosamine-phosphate N-acetyltransferase [Acidobacteriota bacterium]|jgi:bifunctional UDP-N-acetylglucosamine pyrophosphorylase/glucosamine-1-phosphate N-acetyltransferase
MEQSSGIHVVVLAAGKGTRMQSAMPKVLHRAGGLPLIEHVLRAAASLRPQSIVVVIGHGAGQVQAALAERMGLSFAVQEPQLGTGHALLQAERLLPGADGTLVLLSGDAPLVGAPTLAALVQRHEAHGAAATVLTAKVPRPEGYGRIVRDDRGIAAIVEDKDASDEQRRIDEINSGIYAFAIGPLFDALRQIGSSNAQGEYYLPDLVRIYRSRGLTVETVTLADAREILGVNSRKELAEVGTILRAAKLEALMNAGVTIIDPASTFIEPDVAIGTDTILHPGVYLEGQTRIGSGCVIHSGVRIVNSSVDDQVTINNFCVITDSHISRGAIIGPFARLRPQSDVGEDAYVGNFVELKKTKLGRGSKASHLTYLGDSTIGEKVNIGAGTITCNYDGTSKYPTVIEDGAFIGSDSQLIAPVRIGRGAYVAAGSSITKDVPPDALAIGRGKQINKEGWVSRKKKPRT